MQRTLISIDDRVTGWVQGLELPLFLETLICPGGALFGWQGTVCVVIPFVFYVYGKQGLYFHLATIALAQSVCRLGKQIIQRKRPVVPQPTPYRYYKILYRHLLDVAHADGNKDGASFPSGDTMSGGTLGGVLIVLMQSWWPIFIPVWVGIGRQFFFCHWFLDTFFGGLLGLTSAYFMNNVFYSSYRDISDLQMVIIASSFLVLMSISTKVANFCRGHVISKSK